MSATPVDPVTLIAVIAVHLLGAGGLLLLLSWRLPDRAVMRAWSLGALLAALGYAGRLTGSLTEPPLHTLWSDLLLMGAQLGFIQGVRGTVGEMPAHRPVWWLALALAGLHLALAIGLGLQARYISLNGLMGGLYLAMAGLAWQGRQRLAADDGARRSLAVMAAIIGGLGLLTLVRAGRIAWLGTGSLYSGPFSALYFGVGSLVGVLMSLLVLWNVFEQLLRRLSRLAAHDPLTGALNRLGLDEALRRHFGGRHGGPMVVLVADADHFKRVNDQHGHATGDAVLCAIAHTLQQGVRGGDLVARLGGEEFLVACATGDARAAWQLAERLRHDVAALQVPSLRDGSPVQVTLSIGLSTPARRLADWELAASQADAARYAAKTAGRNRCIGPGGGA